MSRVFSVLPAILFTVGLAWSATAPTTPTPTFPPTLPPEETEPTHPPDTPESPTAFRVPYLTAMPTCTARENGRTLCCTGTWDLLTAETVQLTLAGSYSCYLTDGTEEVHPISGMSQTLTPAEGLLAAAEVCTQAPPREQCDTYAEIRRMGSVLTLWDASPASPSAAETEMPDETPAGAPLAQYLVY